MRNVWFKKESSFIHSDRSVDAQTVLNLIGCRRMLCRGFNIGFERPLEILNLSDFDG